MNFLQPLLSDTRDSSSRKVPAGTFALYRARPRRPAELDGREVSSVFALRASPALPRGIAEFSRASESTPLASAARPR